MPETRVVSDAEELEIIRLQMEFKRIEREHEIKQAAKQLRITEVSGDLPDAMVRGSLTRAGVQPAKWELCERGADADAASGLPQTLQFSCGSTEGSAEFGRSNTCSPLGQSALKKGTASSEYQASPAGIKPGIFQSWSQMFAVLSTLALSYGIGWMIWRMVR